MMKTKTALLITALAIGVILLGGCTPQQEEYRFPQSSGEFEIQGLMWRTIAYYYHPGIYREMYNPKSNLRLISKAKNVGANYLLVRAFYNCTEDGRLIGDEEEAERCLREAIATAHNYGIKVFLTPFVESMEFWPERKWELSVEKWTKAVLTWASFAEDNNVKLFAPGFEMALIMDKSEARDWFTEILPQIRQVYSGKVAFAEIPYGEQWEFLEEADVFANYDCVGITIFPWKDYDGTHDLRNFEDLRNHVQKQAQKLNDLGDKYNADCRFVATLGMDFWHGKEPDPGIRAEGYDICLDVLREYNVTGVFLHIWASEADHLGESQQVENMVKQRWIETE